MGATLGREVGEQPAHFINASNYCYMLTPVLLSSLELGLLINKMKLLDHIFVTLISALK